MDPPVSRGHRLCPRDTERFRPAPDRSNHDVRFYTVFKIFLHGPRQRPGPGQDRPGQSACYSI